MANSKMTELQDGQQEQVSLYTQSIEWAIFKMWTEFMFVYEVDIGRHDFETELKKFANKINGDKE